MCVCDMGDTVTSRSLQAPSNPNSSSTAVGIIAVVVDVGGVHPHPMPALGTHQHSPSLQPLLPLKPCAVLDGVNVDPGLHRARRGDQDSSTV